MGRKAERSSLIRITLAGAVCLLYLACIDSPATTDPPNGYASELQLVWKLFDGEYAGFETSGIPWNEILDIYLPLADTVSSGEAMTGLMTALLQELEDGNVLLVDFDGDTIRPFSPEVEVNCSLELLEAYLEPWGFQWRQDGIWGYGPAGEDSVGYMVFLGWNDELNISLFDNMLATVPEQPGLVIDVRLCAFGAETAAYKVVRRFVDLQRVGYLWQERLGSGSYELTSAEPFFISPRPSRYSGDLVVLVGQRNSGPSEAFVCMMDQLPQVTVIGDTTRGAGNWPAGTYSLYGDRQVQCPLRVVLRPDSTPIQGTGVSPDQYVEATQADFQSGVDPVLEQAFELLGAQPPDRPR